MLRKLIWNDVNQNKLMSAATIFFMAISASLLALAVLRFRAQLSLDFHAKCA